MNKYKYYVCKRNGLIYRFRMIDNVLVGGFLGTFNGEFEIDMPYLFHFLKMCRPISPQVVKFFQSEGGYNKSHFIIPQ